MFDKLYIHLWFPIRYDWPDRFRFWAANKLPAWLVYHATVRAYAEVWAEIKTKHPNEITYEEVAKYWEKKR